MPNLHLSQLQKVIGEIAVPLQGGYLRHIAQPDNATIVLEIRAQQQNFQLLLCVAKGFTRAHLIFHHIANPATPLAFCQFLRKHADGARVSHLEIAGDDRVVTLTLERYLPPAQTDNTGASPEKQVTPQLVRFQLVAELWGSHSNLLWLDQHGKIIATLYQHDGSERACAPGCQYLRVPAPPVPALPEEKDFLRPHYDASATLAWNRAAATFYGQSCEQLKLDEEHQRFVRWLAREIASHEKLAQKLWQQLEASEQGEQFRVWGELLKTIASRLPRGTPQVETINYFDAQAGTIVIPLDARLSGRENMEKYFKKYQKCTRGRLMLENELTRIEGENGQLRAIYEEALRTPAAAIDSVKQKLPGKLGGRWARLGAVAQHKAKSEVRQPFHRFRSYDGYEILVGKNARDNEDLTFRTARGNDWWLHAADYPGSHVVVRCGGNPSLPQETLLDAAHLAAHYSKAREHTRVNVLYTRRKCVSKAKRSRVGEVLVSQEKRCQVMIDSERMQRLLSNKNEEI